MKFDGARLKKAFNKAVDAHKLNGQNPTQVRPKIKSISQRRPATADGEDFRTLVYANGMEFVIDEASLASIVHSYTALVAQLTGDATLIEKSFFDEE